MGRLGLWFCDTPFSFSHRHLLLIVFVASAVACNTLADGFKPRDAPAHLAVVEAFKIVIVITGLLFGGQHQRYQELSSEDEFGENLDEDLISRDPEHASRASSVQWRSWSVICAVFVALMSVSRSHLEGKLRKHIDPLSLDVVLPITTICTVLLRRFCFSAHFTALQYHAVLLLFCGFYFVRTSVAVHPVTQAMYPHLLQVAMLRAVTLAFIEFMYKANNFVSFYALSLVLFAFSLSFYLLILAIQSLSGPSSNVSLFNGGHLSVVALPFIEAARDVASLQVITHFDAATESVFSCASLALVLLGAAISPLVPFLGVWGGCLLILMTSMYYFLHRNVDENVSRKAEGTKQVTNAVVFLTISAVVILAAFYSPYSSLQPQALSTRTGVFSTAITHSICVRKLTSVPTKQPRQYHEFDNILLIVFFSHARYDANLDYYKEVYADFFPNMIFIGPASREDQGFSHSYDVVVDSYQTFEDLRNETFYLIAGRMAHHMLYTILKEHDCGYDGYLWAPFDTLLNVPRLQKFNQDQIWYHSPWGEFVPNAALGPADAYINETRHPPPAKISPDPANLPQPWKGWGQDWWWGDPRVGLPVCMNAFNRVPQPRRERLATLTDGQTRLFGGSVDTLYLPNRHLAEFIEILGLFLETDCFFEIAVPTTLHLVLEPGEVILFVDHWWIWQAPFNVTFVRQKWAEGFEVDTFHTFHWGEKDSEGIWRGYHENVDDVRLLLQESAKRQNVHFPRL